MIKLFAMIAALAAARAVTGIASSFLEDYAVCLVSCLMYILISVLFYDKPKNERKSFGIGKGALMLLFFLCTSVFASSLASLAFSVTPQRVTALRGAIAVVAVPFAEELFFRATLFKKLYTTLPLIPSVLISSLIFALCHGNVAAVTVSFLLGIILAFIYRYTGRIMFVTLCHAVNNLLAALVIIPQELLLPVTAVSFFALCLIFLLAKRKFFKQIGTLR